MIGDILCENVSFATADELYRVDGAANLAVPSTLSIDSKDVGVREILQLSDNGGSVFAAPHRD